MAKEDIFSKINLKDYNNVLEDILEQKAFSENVKNLLLSMLYKIENGYEDYKTVKVNATSKKYFLRKIIEIIKNQCKEIELIKPMSEQSKELEEKDVNFIIEKENGKIKVYQNERMMLEALILLSQNEIILNEEYNIFAIGLKEVLSNGNKMNQAEVIRDFNGWSWDITAGQMESKNINLVYQNLVLLLGNSFLQMWLTDEIEQEEEEIELPNNEILRSKYNESFGITKEDLKEDHREDYFSKMKEILVQKYGREKAENFLKQFIKTIIAIGSNRSKKQKEIVLEKQREIKERLNKMQDNRTYLEDISSKKKEINKKIKETDTILSDESLLKKEYEERNSKLPNKEKIFSVSHLVIMLEKERNQYLKEIKQYNQQIQPKEFIKIKQELEEKAKFFDAIEIKQDTRVEEEKQIEILQIEFIECFKEKVKQAETKREITDLIYQLRYYKQIPYKQLPMKQIEEIEKMLINKACTQKILVIFSKNEKLNGEILSKIFTSKIINLENTIYILRYHKGILKIEIYDTTIEEEAEEIAITEKVELAVKLNKKIKVFLN